MTSMIDLCGQPLIHALGWTLLHLCWQGTLVAVVLWCVLGLLGGRSSQARYAAACLALALMVALPLATFAHIASEEYRARAAMDTSAIAIDPGMVLQVSADAAALWPVRLAVALDRALPWVLLAWSVGVLFFVGRLSVGLMVVRRMKSTGTVAPSAELRQVFDTLRHRLGVARAVRLLHSALVQVPTVVGWLRPVVLVPASCLTGMSAMQIEAVLAHELAHIRRHDYLVSVLQSVVEALLFYHPAVWWVSKQIRRERECCCDELAVAVGGDRLMYARALSLLEERRSFYPEAALGANGGVLTMRIKRLLGYGSVSAITQLAAMVVLTTLVAGVGGCIATMARAESRAASPAARTASPIALESAVPLNDLIAAPAVREFRMKRPIEMAQLEAPPAPPAASSDSPSDLVRVPASMIAKTLIAKVMPVYPADAKAAGVQGAVVLRALILKSGAVEDVQAVSGPEILRSSAVSAVQQWRYDPFVVNGQPVDVLTTITVNFSLPDSAAAQVPAVKIRMPNSGDTNSTQIVNSMGNGRGPGIGNGNGSGLQPGEGYSGEVKQIGGGVTAPVVIYKVDPEYSPEAHKAKFQGVVTVGLIVDKYGVPQNVHVTRGIGMGLDENAVAAVKQYRFKPAMENGKPVSVFLNMEVNFKIF